MNEDILQTKLAERNSRRIVECDEDRTLRRISTAIWILVVGSFALAAVVWTVLLCDLL